MCDYARYSGDDIIDPCDAIDTRQAVPAIAAHNGPVYMRLLRGKVPVVLDQYNLPVYAGSKPRCWRGRRPDHRLRANDHARWRQQSSCV